MRAAPIDALKDFVREQGPDALRGVLLLESSGLPIFDRASIALSWTDEEAAQFKAALHEGISPALMRFIYTKWLQIERQLKRVGSTRNGPDWSYVWLQVRLVLSAVLTHTRAEKSEG